jgi:hypothetical protein
MNSNSLLASGNILSSENPSMIQEVVVETGGFDPTAQTGGGHINMVMKEGGNRFSGSLRLDFSNASMQGSNLTDALRARGALVPGDIRDRHDYNGAFGGPIARDKVWFVVGFRTWVTSDYQPGNYYNQTQGTMLYTPDLGRPAYTLNTYKTGDMRVTWQVSPKNKITSTVATESNCSCFFALNGNIAPEAAGSHHLKPEYRVHVDVDLYRLAQPAAVGRRHLPVHGSRALHGGHRDVRRSLDSGIVAQLSIWRRRRPTVDAGRIVGQSEEQERQSELHAVIPERQALAAGRRADHAGHSDEVLVHHAGRPHLHVQQRQTVVGDRVGDAVQLGAARRLLRGCSSAISGACIA